jgi:glycosyltransferase involved in cell wall biosynthesis
VLPYLAGLAALDHRITILSAEKPERHAAEGETVRRLCAAAGIDWQPIRYHQHPPILSGVWDRLMLQRAAVRLQRERHFDIVHCRSYLPAAAGLHLKRRFGTRLLFDMRGFWPEEKVEAGSWPQSNPLFRAVYRYMKRLEARLFAGADHVITLTEAALPLLRARPELPSATPVSVIPCCADFDHFPLVTAEARAAGRVDLGIAPDAHVLAYLGSVGAWYMLDEMLDFFAVYRRRHADAVMLFVSPQPAELFVAAAAARGLPADAIRIRAGTREQVPRLMAAADAGLFFIRPVSSKIASSPTKMAEMMALGLPIVGNAGVGDVAAILGETECGVAIDRFDEASYHAAIDRLERVACSPAQIRAAGLARFDVAEGIRRYDLIYSALLSA